MFCAFGIWHSKTRVSRGLEWPQIEWCSNEHPRLPQSLPALRFNASHLRKKYWTIWRNAMPQTHQCKKARDFDRNALLSAWYLKLPLETLANMHLYRQSFQKVVGNLSHKNCTQGGRVGFVSLIGARSTPLICLPAGQGTSDCQQVPHANLFNPLGHFLQMCIPRSLPRKGVQSVQRVRSAPSVHRLNQSRPTDYSLHHTLPFPTY